MYKEVDNMARRFIQIDADLCIGCNMCGEVCDWFAASSGQYGTTILRPAFLHCIYCQGECTQACNQGAILLVDTSGPHCVLCRDKNTNNFINDLEE